MTTRSLLQAHERDLQRTLVVAAVGLTLLMAVVVFIDQRRLMLDALRERTFTEAVLVAMEDASVTTIAMGGSAGPTRRPV